MSRLLSLAVLLLPLLASADDTAQVRPGPGARGHLVTAQRVDAPVPAGSLEWGDPDHVQYFRYQEFLAKEGLEAEKKDSWPKYSKDERKKKIDDGEKFLKDKFAKLMEGRFLGEADKKLLEAVWGKDLIAPLQRLQKAKELGDPAQIGKAEEAVANVAKKLGNVKSLDLGRLFDNGTEGKGDPESPEHKDFLAAPEKKGEFLASLETPEVKKALASQKAFVEFLKDNDVPGTAVPSMAAMYNVLTKAPPETRAELSHILPTVVRFLKDGKRITVEERKGSLGFAVSGDYDEPERLGITPAVKDTDPVVVGKTLAHEFQHVYDMYTGRYYTIDSEMRGFKVAALYFDAVEKTAPAKYKQLRDGDNDESRAIVRDAEEYRRALKESPNAFHQAVAFGHGYSKWEDGTFEGRVPLREAVNPLTGAPRQLAATRRLLSDAKAAAAALEAQQEKVRQRRENAPSRELDRELEKVTKDLADARKEVAAYDKNATLLELRVRRMQSEADWLTKRSKGKTPDEFDLNLAVDREYVTP